MSQTFVLRGDAIFTLCRRSSLTAEATNTLTQNATTGRAAAKVQLCTYLHGERGETKYSMNNTNAPLHITVPSFVDIDFVPVGSFLRSGAPRGGSGAAPGDGFQAEGPGSRGHEVGSDAGGASGPLLQAERHERSPRDRGKREDEAGAGAGLGKVRREGGRGGGATPIRISLEVSFCFVVVWFLAIRGVFYCLF